MLKGTGTTKKLRIISLLCLLTTHVYAEPPDLSGTYDTGTLTPFERPVAFGDNLYLSAEQAASIQERVRTQLDADLVKSDPDREAPPAGQFSRGYNLFWVDPGQSVDLVDGKFRTSILTRPANGRLPALTDIAKQRAAELTAAWTIIWRFTDMSLDRDQSRAWWLDEGDGRGPYDNMEQRPYAERCIWGTRSTGGPPMLPNIYNNHKRIVQTDAHVMILTEMNHDARIVRIGGTHRPDAIRTWFGDSIGHWEGDTLVVRTTHFKETPAMWRADENLKVTERFTRLVDGNLLYQFEVEDPTAWVENWAGEYTWRSDAEGKVYEVACHEGNHALGNVMRGARVLEAEHASSSSD